MESSEGAMVRHGGPIERHKGSMDPPWTLHGRHGGRHGRSMEIHRGFMEGSEGTIVSHRGSMSGPWRPPWCAMEGLWSAMKDQWQRHGRSMDRPWTLHERVMTGPWYALVRHGRRHRSFMGVHGGLSRTRGPPWRVYGGSVERHGGSIGGPWRVHAGSIERLWRVHGGYVERHGGSMEDL